MIKRISKQLAKGNLSFTITINTLLALISLISGSLAARLLGVIGRGELAAIQTWPTFLAAFSMMGLSEAIVYFSAKEENQAGRYLTTAVVITLISSIPFMVIGYFLLPVLLAAQSTNVIRAAQIYLFIVPLFSLMGLPLQALRGINDFFVWNTMRLMLPFGWVFFLIILGIFRRSSGSEFALTYLVLVALLSLPIFFIVFKRLSGPYRLDWKLWRPMISFGLPSIAASIPFILNLRLDQMLMAGLMPPRVLGMYVVAVAWAGAVSPLLNAIGIVIFPRIASQTTIEDKNKVLVQGVHLAILTACALVIILWCITPFVLPLIFGSGFRQAILSSLILILAGIISNLNAIFEDGARGLGVPKIAFVSECVGLLVTILMLILLLKPLGIVGASIASLLGYSGTLGALSFFIRRITQLSVNELWVPTASDISWLLSRVKQLFIPQSSFTPE